MNAAKRMLLGKYLRPALLVADWCFVNICFALALHFFPEAVDMGSRQWLLWVLINISFLPVAIFESRRESTVLRAIQLDRTILLSMSAVALHFLFFLALTTLLALPSLGLKFYVGYYVLLTVAVSLWAMLSRRLIKYFRRRGYNFLRVVIVGTNSTAKRLCEAMSTDPGFGYKMLGFFDNEDHNTFAGRYCGRIKDLDKFVKDNSVDQIYFTIPGHGNDLVASVKVADDNVVEFFYVPQISRYINRDFQVDNIGAVPVLTIRRNPLKRTVNKVLKRACDLVCSSAFLIVYPLIYIPIAIGIKITSPGPVYFRQERTGYRGKPFTCLKFRTMKVNADADRSQATKNDPRKTRFGEFLRHTSLDELPQFINVFKGDMSVVGPRPHMLKHTEEYSKIVDQYMVRHFVKPGITGWAQVNGYRGITDEVWKMEKRVEHDVWYIEHWNILLDCKIICRTVYNAFRNDKNAF